MIDDHPTRRRFLAGSAAATLPPLAACGARTMDDYSVIAAQVRVPPSGPADMLGFVRFATLAANSHNTQPWRFTMRRTSVSIAPDLTRRIPVVDPDDHHLFVSLGCAAENLAVAAAANGRPATVAFDAGKIDVELASGKPMSDELYRAIPARQSTRSLYDARPVSAESLARLQTAAQVDGVSLIIITDVSKRETARDLLVRGDSEQIDNPAFVRELKQWIRFNPEQAIAAGDGLFTKTTGNPVIPTWIGERFFSLAFKKASENARYAAQLRSSSGLAVFVGDKPNHAHWVKVGRSFQRFALQATALGIRHAHLNQLVEVPAIRTEFARWLGIGAARPDLVVRFGMATPMPMSLRRPVASVIVREV